MPSYTAYGLRIQSALPLPELAVAEGDADVVIRLARVEPLRPEGKGFESCLQATDGELRVVLDGVGRFAFRRGREVIVDPVPGVEESALRRAVLVFAMGMLLHQRGCWLFHASAADISGRAVAFLGGPHAGKSTMAAVLHSRGHPVLADDIMAVHMDAGHPIVLPGLPHLQLWPDSASSVGISPDTLPRVFRDTEKRARSVAQRFSEKPVPLNCVYLLGEGPAPEIESLQPKEALVELIPHWYWVHQTSMEFLRTLGLSSCFFQCAGLAKSVPVRRLKRQWSLEALPELAQMVEEDVATNARPKTM